MKRSDINDKEVCLAIAEYNKKRGKFTSFNFGPHYVDFPYQALAKKFDCPEKLAYSACERACDNGLIEYGVSLRTGWLTDKGKELIGLKNESI